MTMAEKKRSKKETFTADERAAMRERAKEAKAARSRADGESDLLAKVAEMPKADRVMAERIHAIVTASAPDLAPKTWYGMPAYADKDGKVVCFFRGADKFKERYAMFGFNDVANLDKGAMWPVAFALTELTAADEAKLAALVKKAVS
jgi:uncharacterized protein YdhG (YjbR/CyaY superfamily)